MTEPPTEPSLRVVSENSKQDVEKAYALDRLQWELIETAANLLRVVRGAGRPYQLPGQFLAVLQCFERYREIAGQYPSEHELSTALSYMSRRDERDDEWSYAIDKIVRGSLQFAASTLLHQSTQQAAGESELIDGVTGIEKIRERNRAAYQPRPSLRSKAARQAAKEMDESAEHLHVRRRTKKKPPQLD